MKITEISKEYLEKGLAIRRKGWFKNASLKLDKDTGVFNAYINGDISEIPAKITLEDITSDDWEFEGAAQIWKPKFKETYYYINTRGFVMQDTFNTHVGEQRSNFKNTFKTQEEAKHMVQKLCIINKLRELSNINTQKHKGDLYSITYNKLTKQLFVDVHANYIELPFDVYFSSEELARKAIELIGEENLKKYYFDVED